MTSTRMSRAIATTILRTVSACAASPYLTLSSLVTPSTRFATSSPKSAAQLVERVVGVLDRVVEQRRLSVWRGHAELGQDRRDGQGVGDVRLAAAAGLALVVLRGDLVGALEVPEVRARVPGADRPRERLQLGDVHAVAADRARQARQHAGVGGSGGGEDVVHVLGVDRQDGRVGVVVRRDHERSDLVSHGHSSRSGSPS